MKTLSLVLMLSVVAGVRAAQYPSPSDWRDENIYFIFTDRFYDGDPSNNNVESAHGAPYSPADSHAIHGGDLRGVQQKLDYIKMLGATAIWITPIPYNVGGSAFHGYGAQDFNMLAPHWGSMTDLSNMVSAAHARGIKVILDIVCNHSGDLIDSGDAGYPSFLAPPAGYNMRYKDISQQHAPPFNITNATPPTFTSIFHNNGAIDTYSLTQHVVLGELSSLDDFATETTYVRTNMVNVYTNWVGIGDFDGFRIDTVKHVDYGFWQYWCPQLHQFATSIGKTNFFMFGEIFNGNLGDDPFVGSYTGTMGGGPFKLDSTLDYVLYGQINSVFAGAYGPTQPIETHYNQIASAYDTNAWYRLVTFLDNHDNARFLSNAGNNTNRLGVALEFLYTSRGVPCLYYGTEQAFNGTTDPNNREDMFAGQFEQGPSLGDNFNETHPLFQLVAKLNNLRRRYQSLRRGVHNNLSSDPSGPGLFAYSRVFSNEEVFVAFNTAGIDEGLSNCATTYIPGTVLVNLFNTNETITVTTAAGTNTTPSIIVPSMTAKAFIAQSLLQPLDPVIISQSPSHANTNVSIVTPIVLSFSKPMDTNSVQAAFSLTPPKSGAFTWSALHDTMTFTPSAPGWTPLSTNLVHLATNAMDAVNGLTLYAPFDTYFFTLPDIAITATIVSGGNGNGFVDPNECNFLNLVVENIGGKTDTTVNAILTTTTPGVTFTQPLSTYPNLLPGVPTTNATPFKFGTSSPFGCGTPVSLTLALTYAGGSNNVSCVLPPATSTYTVTVTNGVSIVPGTTDSGSHADDNTTAISLPFSYTFYDKTFNSVNLGPNGNLQFLSTDFSWTPVCPLPYGGFDYAIMPLWQDLRTDCTGKGIYTSISGAAPNRIFNIEWRASYWDPSCAGASVNFEVRLYENQNRLDMIYGALNGNGSIATVGIQKDTGSLFNQYECFSGVLSSGLMLTFQLPCADGGGTCPNVANFTGTPTNGPAPLSVTFTDTSIGVITNRFWNFGDNSTVNVTSNAVVHTYSPGTFNVGLTVTGPGLVSTTNRTAYVTALSGFQVWQIQYFGSTNNPLAQASVDPDGDGYNQLQEYFSGTNPTNAASHPTGFPPNLLGWWKFDEGSGTTASDSSLNSNLGTLAGGAWSGGMFGQALSLNGQSQVNVSNSASLNPTNAITVSAWVYDNSGGWYTNPRILEKGKSGNQYALFANGNANQLEFLLAGVSNGALITAPPSPFAWHHLAGTYDGSLISLYLDGQLAAQQPASGPLPTSTDALAIGGRPSGSLVYQFNGLIDDVRVYGRALSAGEIVQLYNADTVGDGIANWWRLQYFGNGSATGATTCATCDYDNTGQNNFFKFVAGLDPTDPASVFLLQIAGVTNQVLQETLTFIPLALGRTYAPQFSTDLVSGIWLPLTAYAGPLTNGSQVTITDTNAVDPQKFYRLHISVP